MVFSGVGHQRPEAVERMHPGVRAAKRAFRRLLQADESAAIIELLQKLFEGPALSPDDRGWVFWNLCDRYAVLRDAARQCEWQHAFHVWVGTECPPSRRHWVVSDATQALSLLQGGYSNDWWSWYVDANTSAPRRAWN